MLPHLKGNIAATRGNGSSSLLLITWVLTLALSFPTDHESPRSYSATLTDLGRTAPRERRGTPEKEVACLVAFESFSTIYLRKHLPAEVMSKTSKQTRFKSVDGETRN